MTTENIPAQASDEPMPSVIDKLRDAREVLFLIIATTTDADTAKIAADNLPSIDAAISVTPAAGAVDDAAIEEIMLAMQVAAEKLEWIASGLAPGKDYDLDGCRVTATIRHAKQMAAYALLRIQPARITARAMSRRIDAAISAQQGPEGKQ